MKKIVLLIILSIATTVKSQTPTLDWVKQTGGVGNDRLNITAVDNSGNVFTTGQLTASDDMVVTKYDLSGVVQWSKNFSGSYPIKPADIKTDSSGNIIIVGEFSALVDFDPSPSSSYNLGVQNYSQSPLFYFILKLNSSGNFVYAKEIGGSPRSLSVDSSQNIYITGTFKFSADFNPSPTATNLGNSVDGYSIFITKLDANANFVWNKVIGKTTASPTGFADCGGNIILNDASDNVLVSGYFTDNIDFDPAAGVTTYVAAGTTLYHIKNPFVLKLNSSGDFV